VLSGDVAGGQLVALRLAHAARAAGHAASFVSPSEGPFLERVRADGFEARVVPVRGALDTRALRALTRTFRSARADVVHTHGHFGVNVVGRVAARLAGARVLSHMHIENAFRAGRGRSAQVAVDNLTARLCFAIVAVSDATRQSLLRQGYPPARVVPIHNGVEPPEPGPSVHLAEGATILEVARLAEVKGQRTLLEALPALAATAVLVGEDLEGGGAYRRELEEVASRLGIAERVVFTGRRDDVPALLRGCDVVCLPSRAEGMPLVLLEAMAQGKPVVATAVGGVPELVVDGECGLLVPPGNPDALAVALRRVLDDRELAARLGEAGRRRVEERFSAAAAAERVLRLYEPPA
jgi:glycosyltransferase involved in cell wall biosynthesis